MTTRVMIRDARLAFPILDKPQPFSPGDNPRYSATLLFDPKGPNHKACLAAMKEAASAKWGPDKADKALAGLTKANKVALIDGAIKSDYDGFEGKMAVSAHSRENAPPTLLDGMKKELPRNTGAIYAGCYVNASVEFWAQDNQFGKRINATIRGVQFMRDGDAFAAGAPAGSDEFDAVEGAEASDSDFGDDAEGDFA